MKKLLVLSIVAAFACISAVQAGETPCDKAKATECSKAKATECSKAQATECSKAKAAACSKATAKKADTSVKGATLLVRK